MGERGPQPGEGGAPRKVIDIQIAARAASLGCTADEIAALLGVGRRTFYDHLKEDPDLKAIDEGRALGRVTLRRLQWRAAEAGNPTMLIWLGKQLLGQRDRPEVGGDPDKPVYVIYAPAPVENTQEWLRRYAPPGAADLGEIIEGAAEAVRPERPTQECPEPMPVPSPAPVASAVSAKSSGLQRAEWLAEFNRGGRDYR